MTDTGEEREGRVLAVIPQDSYANRLMLARAHAGHLTIREAAQRCGLNYKTWSEWERGSRSRTVVEDAAAIAEGLGVDRDWLLHGGQLSPAIRVKRIRCAYPSETLTIRRRRVPSPEPTGRVRRPRRLDRRVAA